MDTTAIVAAAIGFVVVAGIALAIWYVRGRDPVIRDDPSVIMPAPPPEMTAATATIVDGGPSRQAFMAALLDLASRDEIRFRSEGRTAVADRVGIEMRGGLSDDPKVLANRRSPVGEGEAWLLVQLREFGAMSLLRGLAHGDMPSPESMGAASEVMHAAMSFAAFAAMAPVSDMTAARESAERGLLAGPVDPAAIARAYEARTGKPLSGYAQAAVAGLGASDLMTYSDPMAVARDPDGFAAKLQAVSGTTLKPEQLAALRAWGARMTQGAATASPDAAPSGSSAAALASGTAAAPIPGAAPSAPGTSPYPPGWSAASPQSTSGSPSTVAGSSPAMAAAGTYIPAASALQIGAPIFFGTMLQRYATRHGWFTHIPTIERLRWRIVAGVEIVTSVVVAAAAKAASASAVMGLAIGAFGGGLVTWFIAADMPTRTDQGALMRAEIEAYRRTLRMTLAQGATIGDAVGSAGLPWLDTPDRVIVWSVALGLQSDVQALLARDLQTQGADPSGYRPGWFEGDVSDAAAMFAGIEAIGTGAIRTASEPANAPA